MDIPLHNPDEMLIMASIVQKESGVPQELAKIAGLYLHRLNIGMRLQADPTVIYGMGERYEGDIHSVDLRAEGLTTPIREPVCRRRPSPWRALR